jgi:glycerol-3-phosphate dehydrogenase
MEIKNQAAVFTPKDAVGAASDPAGFPLLQAQLRYTIRSEMVVHLEDFYLRRIPLYATRKDHGMPWVDALAQVWAQERGLGESEIKVELESLRHELAHRSAWQV